MHRRHPVIEDSINVLKQGVELIEQVGDRLYASPAPPLLKSGVGSHFRHCIDFYNRFLAAPEAGQINYLLRQRDPLVETNRRAAISEIESIIARLGQVRADELRRHVQVIAEDSSAPAEVRSHSSLMRELQFLLSHTIHHYAIIALALRLQGFEPETEFGVAPSTLAYWRQTA
jgi:hypothetical protein